DCFSNDLDKLINNPTILIASQVISYVRGKELENFIEKLISKKGFISIIIAQAHGSITRHTGEQYDNSTKQPDTEDEVTRAVASYNSTLSSTKILYGSTINFPPNLTYEYLLYVAQMDFNQLNNSTKEYQVRCLLEFIAGTSMERLICLDKNKFNNFIEDIIQHLALKNGTVGVWSYMSLIIPREKVTQEALDNTWQKLQKLALSGGLNSFDLAAKEGNYEIILSIHRQGLMSCSFNDYEYNNFIDILEYIKSFMGYQIRLSDDIPEILNFLKVDVDNYARYRNYISYKLVEIRNIKYNFITQAPDKVSHIDYSMSFRGARGNDFLLARFPLLYGFIWAIPIISPAIIFLDLESSCKFAIGMCLMFPKFFIKFIHTSAPTIHYIRGDDVLIQFYLNDKDNLNSLKFQNSEGHTALHKAILEEDDIKSSHLLNCANPVVEKLVKISDSQGYLPLHYASAKNNIKATKYMINHQKLVDSQALGSWWDLALNIVFFSGKIIYLHTCFVGSINLQDKLIPYKYASLLAIYGMFRYNNIKFPDNIYYEIFLHKLNQYDDWGDYLAEFNQIYKSYSQDTALHLSTKNNHTELSKFLVASTANVNLLNSKGESPLHLAAANNNLELIDLYLKNGADINAQTTQDSYPFLDLLIKSAMLYFGSNCPYQMFGEVVFLKIIYDEIFSEFYGLNSAAPLHYAIKGVSLSDHTLGITEYATNIQHEAVKKLVDSGADCNISMTYYKSLDMQLIPYIVTKAITIIYDLPYIQSIPLLFIIQTIFSYENEELKFVDLIGNANASSNLDLDIDYYL
ncbi:MAG: ankyrin repeat domain-containing protein, partial [Pseudomonadota bacterium]